jgi:hypothetical protein
MRNLLRPRFLDLLWDAEELDLVAELWLRLYEQADAKTRFGAWPYHALSIRLRGFPRGRTDSLGDELCRRMFTPAFPEPLVARPDPDTLEFVSGYAAFAEQPAHGLGLPFLRGEPFDGLLAEVRFTAAGFRGGPEGKSRVEATLVMVGELRDGRLLVKALWKAGPTGWEDAPHWLAPWAHESELLGTLSRFRVTGTVPDDLAGKLFITRGIDRMAKLAVAFTSVPLDGPRLGGLLLRLLLFTVAFALGVNMAAFLLATGLWYLLAFPVLWILLFGWLFTAFVGQQLRLFFRGRAAFHRAYSRVYAKYSRILPLPPEEAVPRLDNPWARKYTAELLAVGCTHTGLYRLEDEAAGRNVISLFLAPDGVTYVIVMVLLGGSAPGHEPVVHLNWPALVNLWSETWFVDGARFASINSRHEGNRRKLTGPEMQMRVFRDVTDPAELLHRHTEAMRRFAAATGREPARHTSAAEFIRLHEHIQEVYRQLYKKAPYTWTDHLYWYLGLVRRAYRPE